MSAGFHYESTEENKVAANVGMIFSAVYFEKGGFKKNTEKDRYYTGDYPEEYLSKKGDLINNHLHRKENHEYTDFRHKEV